MRIDDTRIMTTNATHPGKQAWLQALMLRDPGRWSSRLGALVMWMKTLGRGRRRQFARVSAGVGASAAGIALLALLAGPLAPPVAAAGATITVDNTTCTLIDAIKAANTNSAQGGCVAGTGDDVIVLQGDVTIITHYAYYNDAYSGTPLITSKITIDGQDNTLSRSSAEYFRLLTADSAGDLTIRDLTLSGGDVSDYIYSDGGAIYTTAPLTLENVTFSGNKAGDIGGAIYFQGNDPLIIVDSTFTGNVSGHSGGAFFFYSPATITISNTTFSNNTAVICGGAFCGNNADLTITNSTFTGNSSSWDGGALALWDSTVTIDNSTFSNNQATSSGGAIYMAGALDITNSTLSSNTSGYKGGAIYHYYDATGTISSSVSLDGVQLITNTATNDGGAIYIQDGSLTVNDSLISGNRGAWGGSVIVEKGPATITNSEVKDNTATTGFGGGVLLRGNSVISNTILSGNAAGFGGGAMSFFPITGNYTLDVVDSTFTNNNATRGGGIYLGSDTTGTITIRNSTIDGNASSPQNGGGVHVYANVDVTFVNSTISGNSSGRSGGALYSYNNNGLTFIHTTVTGNSAAVDGGAIYTYQQGTSTLSSLNSIFSGNTANGLGTEVKFNNPLQVVTSTNTIWGSSAVTSTEAFNNFTPSASDFVATSDDENVDLSAILDTTLADNGGLGTLPDGSNTKTHNLPKGSPAINIARGETCDPDTDQRGVSRPYGDGCDAGAVEYPVNPVYIFLSANQSGTIAGLGDYGDSDILMWDGDVWTKWLGAEVISAIKSPRANINAFWIPDPDQQEIVMGFKAGSVKLDGVKRRILGTQLAKWDGTAFSLYFDGPDVGLSAGTKERIDALHILPSAPDGRNGCEAYLLISTEGQSKVKINGQSAVVGGEDLLGFCATSLGEKTAGTWEMVVDGSVEGLRRNSLDSVSASDDGKTIYLTTSTVFSADGVSGGHSMVYVFDVDAGTFSGSAFDAATNGLTQKVDGLQVVGEPALP